MISTNSGMRYNIIVSDFQLQQDPAIMFGLAISIILSYLPLSINQTFI